MKRLANQLVSSKWKWWDIVNTKKEKNYLKETINKGNEIGEINEIEKDTFELNLIKKTEDDENNKGTMSNLKDFF